MAYHEGYYSGEFDQNSWQVERFNGSHTAPVDYDDRAGIRYHNNNQDFQHSASENIRQYDDDPAEDYSRHAGDGRVEYRRSRGHDSYEARNYDNSRDFGLNEDYGNERNRGTVLLPHEDKYRNHFSERNENCDIPPFDEDFQRLTDSKRHHEYRGQDGYTHQENGNFRQDGNWNYSFDFKVEEGENMDDRHLISGERHQNSRDGFVNNNVELDHIDTNLSDEESMNREYLHQRSIRRITNRTKTLIRKRSKFSRKSDFIDSTFRGSRRSTVKKGTLPSYQRDKSMTLQQKLDILHQQNSTHDVAKFFRDQIVKEPVEKLKGFSAWRQRQYQSWERFKWQAKSMVYQLEPWAGDLKSVEGQFGSSIMSYFRFVRWLMFLNLYMSLVVVCLTLIPHLALSNSPAKFEDLYQNLVKKNVTDQENKAVNCTLQYENYLEQKQEDIASNVLDFLQGTGWMEHTVLFYGVYFNKTYPHDGADSSKTYNMCLSYLLATGSAFLISFLLIVRNSSKSMQGGSMSRGGTITLYCNKVLAGWDYCISDQKTAGLKKINIHTELTKDLEEQRLQWKKASRTTRDMAKLYLIRGAINFAMLGVLIGSLYLIYFSFEQLLTLQKKFTDLHPVLQILIQYLPSLTITLLNVLIPVIFKKVVVLEVYSPAFEMRMTLLRTILLRLASLGVLMVSLYNLLEQEDDGFKSECGNKRWSVKQNSIISNTTDPDQSSSVVKCWETYVGQQIYKLVLLDFLVPVVVTFVVEFPRSLIYKKLKDRLKLVDMIGLPEVDLPKIVLDLVYGQTLCWFGLFFSPLIPVMCFAKCFIFFYLKKVSMMNNYIPPMRPYRTSRSNSLFIGMLFISFILACIPVSYMIGNFNPSMSCGPFRVYSTANYVFFDTVAEVITTWPWQAQNVFFFLGTTAFFIPAILIMCLVTYYFWALKEGYLKMESLLQEQLRMEGRDKQFLLGRVNAVWQRIEED